MIILIGSNKGGCGKSTTVINLAVAFAKDGKEVLVVDADHQSSASRWSSDREYYEVQPYIQVLQKHENLKPALDTIEKKYDVILVDVAGRNSREMLSAMLAANLLVCPLQCSQYDLDTLDELKTQVTRAKDFNPKLETYIYQTMASTNTKVKDKERNDFKEYIGGYEEFKLLGSINSFRKVYKDTISEGKAIIEFNNSEATEEVTGLFKEIKKILKMK